LQRTVSEGDDSKVAAAAQFVLYPSPAPLVRPA